ncbi:MAG: peptide deformylase [Clostridiales bacterium]|nr:peptide deformylase [Clostridiales bacterium]
MAIRNIRTEEDNILRKKSREVTKFDKRLNQLLDDMAETMYAAPGIGLAGVQVGTLKRVAVIDIGENLIELINGKVIKEEGTQVEIEGCLSIPDVYGKVERPEKVTVSYLDRDGVHNEIYAEGLLAVALSHEIDHFDGILFRDKVIEYIDLENVEDEEQENQQL